MTVPGDIKTTPFDQLWYNAPFDQVQKVRIRLTNGGVRRIGFYLKSTVGRDRIKIDPPNGCLAPSETTTLMVAIALDTLPARVPLEWMVGGGVITIPWPRRRPSRVTIEWTDAPVVAPKKYTATWFTGDAIVRRKNLAGHQVRVIAG